MTSASTSLILVGWDDIKGRPIYSKKPPASSSSSSSAPAKKNKKVPVKKGIATAAKKAKTKSRRSRKNENGRRNIPNVQVAVSSLMASTAADAKEINLQSSSHNTVEKRSSKPARKVSFSPTIAGSKSCDDIKRRRSNKPLFVPKITISWDDKKRKGYGSKKFSRSSGYIISPVIVLGDAENVLGWGKEDTTSAVDTTSIDTEKLNIHENETDEEVLSVVNDDYSSSSRQSTNNDHGVDLSFSPAADTAGDIQSVGHDSTNSSLDNHYSGSEQKHRSDGSFSYGQLDNRDDIIVHPPSIDQPKNDSIPEIINVETDVTVTNHDDDDLTAKAEVPTSTTKNSVGHHHLNNNTPSTKTAEETSYKLHSGGTNDFVDYDIPLLDDEPNATDNIIQKGGGKKRSYGCSVKPVWNRQAKVVAAAAVTSDNVVGWDEEKCRPIFHAKSKKKVDENELDESNDDIGDEFANNDANKTSHKRRYYSSRFRKTSLTKAIEQMSVDTTPKEADDHLDIESTQEESNGDNIDLVNENGQENGSSAESNADLDMEMEEMAFDENARHIQPTDSSSLEAARAFFRYLDSTHRLVVDQSDASPRVSSEVIRTARQIVHSEQLLTEYSEYCNHQTDVAPITITEFANNWNRYFVGKGRIRDGLLDED